MAVLSKISTPVVRRLAAWLTDLSEDFGDEVPNPEKTNEVLAAAETETDTRLIRDIGSCSNGLAFLSNKNTVVKFTIDEQEAILWGQLWGSKPHRHIAQCFGSWQLASSILGTSLVFMVHVEYVPYPLDESLAIALRQAVNLMRQPVVPIGVPVSRNASTMHRLRALRQAAISDQRIQGIIDAIVSLTDLGVHIFDIQPDNFRLAADRQTIKLIDPSVPVGAQGQPDQLLYEYCSGIGVGHLLVY